MDHYSILGISYNATQEEIRNAYFLLARSLHSDKNPDSTVREKFLAVQEAYETLSNPKRRAAYDSALPFEARQVPAISVSVRASQSAYNCLDEPQLGYILVDLMCTADLDKNKIRPAHICLVLDKSTSMQGQRMDMVKAAAMNLLQQLRPQDYLSVVAFGDRSEVIIPQVRVSALNKSDHRISLLQTGGSTEIYKGLALGLDQLQRTDSGILRQLILLTDGHTYGDEEGCIRLAKEAAEAGISINVLGIGHEWNDIFMDQIASLSGGNTLLVTSPRDLDHFVSHKLAELGSMYASGLRFEFRSASEVKLRYAFRLSPDIGPMDTNSPILLGNLLYKQSLSFLLEFLIPPFSEEVEQLELAAGEISMGIPGQEGPSARLLLDLHCSIRKDVEPETPPAVIVEAMSKLTLYRLQEKVRQEVSEGQVDKATRHMHYLATHLLSQGDRELAHAVLMEAEQVQQSRHFSGEGEKRIKYGTRALLLPPGMESAP